MNLSQFCDPSNRLPDASRANFEYFTRKSTRMFPSWSQCTGGAVSSSTRRLKTKHLIRQNCSLIQYLCVNHDGLFIHDIFKQAAVPGSCDLKTQITKNGWQQVQMHQRRLKGFWNPVYRLNLLSERQYKYENNQLLRDTSCIVLRSLSSTLELTPVDFLPWTDMSSGLSCQPYGMPKSLFLCFSSKVNALNWVCGSSLDTHTWFSGLQAADAGFWNVVAPVGEALIKTAALKLRGRKGERLPRNV